MKNLNSGAILSPCLRYRYRLWRQWVPELPTMVFVMLNPSTADENTDDATIRKCMGFARRQRFGGIEVVNLYAFRATKPADLWTADDPIGPQNDGYLRALCNNAVFDGGMVLAAWGNFVRATLRGIEFRKLMWTVQVPLYTLRKNANGSPAHPLMLPYSCEPTEWRPTDDEIFGSWVQ